MSITTGRTLDADGEPIPGTGMTVDPGGPVADRLRERAGPLMSNPVTGDWATVLVPGEATDGERATGLGLFSPGSAGPPAHYHVGYSESFRVLRGEFAVEMAGETHRLAPGDEVTVPPETEHAVRNVGDDLGATVTTTRPAARTLDVLRTQFGLAHEGDLDDDGEPGLLQAMAMADEMRDDTVFASPPPAVAKPLAALLGPVARAAGYEATYERHGRDAFWERHVERPAL